MLEGLLLNPSTRANLAAFLDAPTHALLLVGPRGSGKRFIAATLAADLLGVEWDKLASHPHYVEISRPEGKKDIPIESVRQATKLLGLKIPGQGQVRRVVVVQDAQAMNAQAQNAFLKSLEEPPAGTVFILTSESASSILPTIASRVQKVAIHTVDLESAKHFYAAKHASAEVSSAWVLSEGLAGTLDSILEGRDENVQAAIDQAKVIFRQNTYERLVNFDKLSKDKEQLATVLAAMARITKALYRQTAAGGKPNQTQKLLVAAKLISSAQNDLAASVSPKLVSLKLILNLPL